MAEGILLLSAETNSLASLCAFVICLSTSFSLGRRSSPAPAWLRIWAPWCRQDCAGPSERDNTGDHPCTIAAPYRQFSLDLAAATAPVDDSSRRHGTATRSEKFTVNPFVPAHLAPLMANSSVKMFRWLVARQFGTPVMSARAQRSSTTIVPTNALCGFEAAHLLCGQGQLNIERNWPCSLLKGLDSTLFPPVNCSA